MGEMERGEGEEGVEGDGGGGGAEGFAERFVGYRGDRAGGIDLGGEVEGLEVGKEISGDEERDHDVEHLKT